MVLADNLLISFWKILILSYKFGITFIEVQNLKLSSTFRNVSLDIGQVQEKIRSLINDIRLDFKLVVNAFVKTVYDMATFMLSRWPLHNTQNKSNW